MKDNGLRCFIDGDCLCIVNKDFVNLEKDEAVFVHLILNKKEEIEQLINRDK